IGVMGGAAHLARLVPTPQVRWMFFTGQPLSAERLYELGRIIEVVDRDELLACAHRHAQLIASHSPTGPRVAKRRLNTTEFLDLQRAYELEQGDTCLMADHPDSKEALRAWRERRTATYLPPA